MTTTLTNNMTANMNANADTTTQALLENLDPRIKNEQGKDLWSLCFDETIDWKLFAHKNLRCYNEMFNYDGPLYCLSLLHQLLFAERQLVRQESEYTKYDEDLFKLGRLSRLYRNNINKEVIEKL